MLGHTIIAGETPSGGATSNPVWTAGGATSYAQLLTGTALELVSSSANDASGGTGARTVRVKGLDANYNPFEEVVTLNGTTPVALANTSVIAINKLKVVTAGSGGVNAGTITCRTVSGSVTKSSIGGANFSNQSQDFIYTVPANTYGLLKHIDVYASGLTGNLQAFLRTFDSNGIVAVEACGQCSLSNTGFADGRIQMKFGNGLYIPQKTLIVLNCIVSAGTAVVSAIGEIELQ
mgnify:CR=1 FL=1